jgi:Predicted pyridoxal phosphate-dependent enzyme apparently involved in regulation of cell wall biogenesis
MNNEARLNKILSLVKDYIDNKETDKQKADWVNYSGPHMDSDEYVEAVKCILGNWLVFGEKCRSFETEFSQNLGKEYGILTNSGSSANLLMTYALLSNTKMPKEYRLKKGDKFITPVVCFPTTVNPLIQLGFEPVFVDVDLPSLNLNLDEVERILKEDTEKEIKGIIFAHVLGNPPDMDRVMEIVKKYDLIFLEDSCDALGSTYKGKKLGSFGLMSTCSFYPAHHMTLGEGGYVATSNYRIQKTLASLRDWGRACFCNEKKPGNVVAATACGNRFKCWFPL